MTMMQETTKMDDDPGVARLLLAVAQTRRLISDLLRSQSNPFGFASQESLDECSRGLIKLGLIREESETGSRALRWLVVTVRGMRVAEKLRKTRALAETESTRQNDI
jgi:hypothetical protein